MVESFGVTLALLTIDNSIGARYGIDMIESFACSETEKIWNKVFSRKLPGDIQTDARRKLIMLNAAATLDDLRIPPRNMLEKLSGDREGQYSIRINQQWRVCFCFEHGIATQVMIVDYH